MILTSYNLYCGELFSIPGKNIIFFFFLFILIKAILNTLLGCIFLSILEPLEAPALFAFQVFTFSSPFKRQSFLRVSSFQGYFKSPPLSSGFPFRISLPELCRRVFIPWRKGVFFRFGNKVTLMDAFVWCRLTPCCQSCFAEEDHVQ